MQSSILNFISGSNDVSVYPFNPYTSWPLLLLIKIQLFFFLSKAYTKCSEHSAAQKMNKAFAGTIEQIEPKGEVIGTNTDE